MATTSPPLSAAPREAVLVVNAHSRTGQAQFEEAKAKLEAAGITLIAAHGLDDPSKLAGTVRAAVAGGAAMVIVGGGDGSLSGTVDELVGSDCVFAPLPLGTANSFARTLGMPLTLEAAVEALATGHVERVDLGLIDGDYFANAASIGISPMIGETVPASLKKYLGRVGYLAWAARCFATLRPFRLILTDEAGKERRMWSTEVRILNGRYHGGVELSDKAEVTSGEIVIQAVIGRSLVPLLLDWYAKFFKLRSRDAHTEEFHGRAFTLDTRPRLPISIDGEVTGRTPAKISIAPGAVKVVVPAPERKTQ